MELEVNPQEFYSQIIEDLKNQIVVLAEQKANQSAVSAMYQKEIENLNQQLKGVKEELENLKEEKMKGDSKQ